jgi:hypothetical protein
MTPEQIYAVKRVLMLSPDELATLRENMRLHDDAISRIQGIFNPSRPNSEALNSLTAIHDQIQHRA